MCYRSLDAYCKETFGKKIYKIALSTPFTCPNRDGTKGVGGCAFCSGAGSGNFAAPATLTIPEQIRLAKERVKKKVGAREAGYIAYFQAFTSTYGPIDVQRDLFGAAIAEDDIAALSVATRPDCLPDEVLDLLEELNRTKPVWVELGLQTARDDTARLLNRCYESAVFREATKKLTARHLGVIAHLILGLPGESHDDEIRSVRFVCESGVMGIKLQLLHVLKNTPLAETAYTPLEMDEYVWRVTDLLRYIEPAIVICRLTGDGDKRELLAPLWSADKKRVRAAIEKRLRKTGIRQGEAL